MNDDLAVFVMITSTIVAMFFFGRWVGERSNLKELDYQRRMAGHWFTRYVNAVASSEAELFRVIDADLDDDAPRDEWRIKS